MSERFFNWEYRPAIMRDTPPGGREAFVVQSGAEAWSRALPVEVLESGTELSHSAFLEMFPNLPVLERLDTSPSSNTSNKDSHELRAAPMEDSHLSLSPEEIQLAAYEDRKAQKEELFTRGFSNALAEAWLDRSGYPRPPGWHSVFFYPESMRPRNTIVFWLGVSGLVAWFAY